MAMLLGEIFHTLTLTPPCILYSCQIQYMSCSFHCTSGKDFSLLKKKKKGTRLKISWSAVFHKSICSNVCKCMLQYIWFWVGNCRESPRLNICYHFSANQLQVGIYSIGKYLSDIYQFVDKKATAHLILK